MKFGNIQIYKIGVTTSFSSKSCLANKQFRTYVVNNIKKREKKSHFKNSYERLQNIDYNILKFT
jgi:hypothetical protein